MFFFAGRRFWVQLITLISVSSFHCLSFLAAFLQLDQKMPQLPWRRLTENNSEPGYQWTWWPRQAYFWRPCQVIQMVLFKRQSSIPIDSNKVNRVLFNLFSTISLLDSVAIHIHSQMNELTIHLYFSCQKQSTQFFCEKYLYTRIYCETWLGRRKKKYTHLATHRHTCENYLQNIF